MSAAPPQLLATITPVRRPGRVAYAGLAATVLASAVTRTCVKLGPRSGSQLTHG